MRRVEEVNDELLRCPFRLVTHGTWLQVLLEEFEAEKQKLQADADRRQLALERKVERRAQAD